MVIRTLKDPPEIWDLVHTAPKGFNARSAFVARFNSMRRGFAFRALMVVVLASVCAVGVWVLRGVQARGEANTDRESRPAAVVSAPSAAAPNPAVPNAPSTSDPPAGAGVIDPNARSSAAAASGSNSEVVTPDVTIDKPVFTRRRSVRITADGADQRSNMATNDVSQPAAPLPGLKMSPQTRTEQGITNKNRVHLSPQLIAPVKSATPKAKVIQWP
jgi:hypothetical protein